MLAKVIAYGPDRATALRRLRAALADTVTLGVATNAGFLRRLLAHPAVVAGELDTGLVEREVDAPGAGRGAGRRCTRRRRCCGWRRCGPGAAGRAAGPTRSRCRAAGGWAASRPGPCTTARAGPRPGDVRVRARHGARSRIGPTAPAPHDAVTDSTGPTVARLRTGGLACHTFARRAGGDWLGRDGDTWQVRDHDPVAAASLGGAAARGRRRAHRAHARHGHRGEGRPSGDEVAAGQSLLVVEAMKMEHVISAPHAGTVTELDVTPGTTVAMDQVLAVIAPHDETDTEATR